MGFLMFWLGQFHSALSKYNDNIMLPGPDVAADNFTFRQATQKEDN